MTAPTSSNNDAALIHSTSATGAKQEHLDHTSVSIGKPSVSETSKAQKKLATLRAQVEETARKTIEVESQLREVQADLGDEDAKDIVQRHIKQLHEYNEIKDVALGLFGLIADQRGVRVKEIYEEFGITEDD